MGIFTRFRDIVSSNINSMLDHAEDPEKLIKLMIREMEDTLVEIKAACAGVMAAQRQNGRRLEDVQGRESQWRERARLAVDKGRDDLAREALVEKRRFTEAAAALESEISGQAAVVAQYQDDIRQLEDKLRKAQEKQRVLVQRHLRAHQARRAREEVRRADSYETVAKFDELESRIERMEAEADLVNYGRRPGLEEEFFDLAVDEDIERELEALKSQRR